MLRILFIILIFITNEATAFELEVSSPRSQCEKSSGIWREFGDSCADSCYLDRGRTRSCFSNIESSCDCLKGKCWDGKKCIKNETYQENELRNEKIRLNQLEEKYPELFLDRETLIKLSMKRQRAKNNTENQAEGGVQSNQSRSSGRSKNNSNNKKPLTKSEMIQSCSKNKGIWKRFSNDCADNCSQISVGAICNAKTTESCDCGKDKCWNGFNCATN